MRQLMVAVLLLSGFILKAQDNSKIKFGAYSRALSQTSTLGKEDTSHVDKMGTGHVLLDLGIHITPDKKTEIMAIVRFKSDLNGFYGAGTSAILRQMYVRGIIGKAFNYQVGDLYLELSPYTFYNNVAEGSVNEATIFRDIRRDYTNYENLSNRGTAWWQQGFYGNFALGFKDTWMDTIRFDAFCLRNRTSNFISVPTSMQAGGRVTFTQSPKLKFAMNYVNLFEIPSTLSPTSTAYGKAANNQVGSLEVNYKIMETATSILGFNGEVGASLLAFDGDTVDSKKDYFYTGTLKYKHKPSNLTFTAGYSYVGSEYYSSAAQTKRVNFALAPSVFPEYGNDPFNPYTRNINIFDLVRDPNVYNAGITRQLMAYDPTLANAQPYGKATPNRKGFNLGVHWEDSSRVLIVDVQGALLSDVVGQGDSTKLRSFQVLRTTLDFNVHNLIGFKRRITLTAGHRYEHTHRDGNAFSSINLNSNLADLGLEMETLKKLDLLLGMKVLLAKGNEFIEVRNSYNDIIAYDKSKTSNINSNSNLYAFGVKYRFTEKTYLTLQDHIFYFKDKNNSLNKYSINQVIILFNMNF